MKRLALSLIAVCGMFFVPADCGAAPPGPTTWLDRPLDGTSLSFPPPPGPVVVQAHASDADGVATIEFFVDDVSLGSAPAGGVRLGEASVEWNPTAAGTYTVRARAIDAEGTVGPEDTSVVIVGGPVTATPTRAPTLAKPNATAPVEVEVSLTADRTSLQPGECAQLTWTVQGGFGVELNGQPVERSGTQQVCPRETIVYKLAVDAGDRVEWGEVLISIAGEVEPPAAAQEIAANIWTNPDAITSGECAVLFWEVGPPGNWGILLDGQQVAASGSQQVCPTSTKTYELLVEAPGGNLLRFATLNVAEGPGDELPPPELVPPAAAQEISANIWTNPDGITSGESAVLSWEVGPPGNWGILLDGQQVAASGSQQVCPTSTKTYELLVEAPGGNLLRFATLNVAEGPGDELPPPELVPPAPGPSQGGADVRPSDLFPQAATVWTRITNDGHDTLSNNKVEVTVSGCGAGKQYALNIAPGQTQTIDTGCQAATGSHSYNVSVKAIDFSDPNGANNTYSETLEWGGAAPPPPPPLGITPPSGPSQPSSADLAITDLFPQTLQGPVYGRITNRGPAAVSNLTVPFSCRWTETDAIEGIQKTDQIGPRNITITSLSPGQTTEFNTNISVEVQQFQYDMTCTLHGPANDPNTGNNTYSEKISR